MTLSGSELYDGFGFTRFLGVITKQYKVCAGCITLSLQLAWGAKYFAVFFRWLSIVLDFVSLAYTAVQPLDNMM